MTMLCMRPGWHSSQRPDKGHLQRSFLASVHAKGYRLDKQSYIDIINEFPELYNIFPDDIKCQELELASKL